MSSKEFFMKKYIRIHFWVYVIILVALGASINSCGFHLRSTNTHSTQVRAPINPQIQLNTQNSPPLLDALQKQFWLHGFVPQDGKNQIHTDNTQIARYELIGVLTEIRLVLSTDVRYQIGNQTHTHTLTATRSYQYNEAGLSTSDKESTQITRWLYEDLAQQIFEQYYTLHQNQTTP